MQAKQAVALLAVLQHMSIKYCSLCMSLGFTASNMQIHV